MQGQRVISADCVCVIAGVLQGPASLDTTAAAALDALDCSFDSATAASPVSSSMSYDNTVVYLIWKSPQEGTPDTPSAHQIAAGRWSPIWRIWPEAMPLECKASWAAHDPAPGSCLCARHNSANTGIHLSQPNPASAVGALQPCVRLTISYSWAAS